MIALEQIEFISLAMLDLIDIQQAEGRVATEDEIDAALELPPLH